MDSAGWQAAGHPLAPVLLLLAFMPLAPVLTQASKALAATARVNQLYDCVQRAGQAIMCDIVREIYSSERMVTANGTMFITDYCKHADILPVFERTYQPFCNCNLMETDFDFSFGYDVLTSVCVQGFEALSEECRGAVHKLRELVSEKVYDEEEEDVVRVVEAIRNTQAAIYTGLGQIVQKDFSQNMATVEEILNNPLETHNRYDEGHIVKKSDILLPSSSSQLVTKGYKELSERYEKLADLNPRTWVKREDGVTNVKCFEIHQTFTQLKILESNRAVDVKDLLRVRRMGSVEEKAPGALLLCGLAGSDKTSLCRYLVHDWCRGSHRVNNLSNFHLVFLVEVRRVRSRRLREFLLDELMPNTSAGLDSDLIIPTLKELDVLFIIDGYDETDKISSELLEDIFAKFGDKHIIITTRPELYTDAVCVARRHRVEYLSLDICGFDTERRDEFIRKVFGAMEENVTECEKQIKEFLQYIHERRNILSDYLALPLTTALLMLSWRHNPEVVNQTTTATRLYQEFYHHLQKKLAERLSKDFIGVNELPDILDSLFLCLGEQAWAMLKQENYVISDDFQNKIEEECKRNRIKVVELLSGLHMCHLHDDPDVWKLRVAFLHHAQAYYLAATFLAHSLQKGKLRIQDIGSQVGSCPGLEQVLLFLTGHLAFQNALTNSTVGDIFNIMKRIDVDPANYDFWWNIFVESHTHPQVGIILARDKLSHKHWQVDETNVVSALRLICFTPVRLVSVYIDIPTTTEPHDIPSFLQTLQNVGENLKKRQRKLIKVELHLRRHDACDQRKTSDDFLRALESWGDLTSFTGSLGDQPDDEVLARCCSLKVIQVRIATVGAFMSLSNSLRKIHRSVKSLHVTLALPGGCPVETLSELRHNGSLEICLVAMKDEQKEWLVSAIKKMGGRGGCRHLSLQDCEMTYDGLEWIVTHLKGTVHSKISIEAIR
ncbi:uncharacterized protein [Procambarus clarkii]|uniref:uncharacterized protein n=1 Tax=Procambarus clarkii TaxID=6728 RepID=UPI003742A8BF